MTNGWSMRQSRDNSIVFRVLGPGSEIEGEEDEDGDVENWTVPEGEIALMFQQRYVSRYGDNKEHVGVYDMFFVHGTPQDIWNALGAAMQALPEP